MFAHLLFESAVPSGTVVPASEISAYTIRSIEKTMETARTFQPQSSLSVNVQPSFDRDADAPNSAPKLGACTSNLAHAMGSLAQPPQLSQAASLTCLKRRNMQHQTRTCHSLRKCYQLKKNFIKLPSRDWNTMFSSAKQMETKLETLHMNMHEQLARTCFPLQKCVNSVQCLMVAMTMSMISLANEDWEILATPPWPTLRVAKTMGSG